MPSFHAILFAFLLPACVCGAILLAAARGTARKDRGWRWNSALGAWALGLAYGLAHVQLVGFPAWPSVQRTPTALDWLGWTIAATLPLAGLFLAISNQRSATWILRAILACALVSLSLRVWEHAIAAPWIAAASAALLITLWASTDALAARSPGPIPVLPLYVTMLCCAVSALLGHSALVALLAGVLCACLGACAVVARIESRFQLSAGAVAVFMLVFGGVLLNGIFFSDLHWSSALFSCLALVSPWSVVLGARKVRGPWASGLLQASIAAVFGVAAIAAAHLNAPSYEY